MSIEIIIVFALLLLAVVLFATEWVPFDVTALIITAVLLVTGILSPEEGLSGFSNPATITIGCMFVLSEGLRRTGLLNKIGDYFLSLARKNFNIALMGMMLIISFISAFINNTAAVALFIPVMVGAASQLKVSVSKLLMPLSFASMFGGVCTLIGTSTNILVSSIAEKHGLPAFSMFEFTPLGVILLIAGMVYMYTIGIKLIPERREGKDLTNEYNMNSYLADVIIEPGFEHLGQMFDEKQLTEKLELDVLRVFKKDDEAGKQVGTSELIYKPSLILEPGDVLRIRGSVMGINKLLNREDLTLKSTHQWFDLDIEQGKNTLVEAVIAPESNVEGESIGEVGFYDRFGAIPLAVRHHGRLRQERLANVKLSGGDTVLLAMDKERLLEVQRDPVFVVISEVGIESYIEEKMPVALLILAGVVGTAAFGWVHIVVSALIGSVLLILTGCLTAEEMYRSINWKVIFLLAGVLPLGIAMDKTGAAEMISSGLIYELGALGPSAVVSGFFLVSMLLTNFISNQATAALLAPIAIQTAVLMDVHAQPFLMAVTFAASLSFMTPVGYQTNTLIYGPGQYKFTDFTKVGTPLNILLWIIATIMIPVIWSF